MSHYTHCPACIEELNENNYIDELIVCSCGWTHKPKPLNYRSQQIKELLPLTGFASLLLFGFLMIVTWNHHAVRIIPLKISQWTNSASTEDLNKIALICNDRKMHECELQAYLDSYKFDSSQKENLARAGVILFKLGQVSRSVDTLRVYFSAKGEDLNVRHIYAKALAALKHFPESKEQYQLVLKAKPRVFQVTVARNYVEMLIEAGETTKAKELIKHYRTLTRNAALFMHKELQELNGTNSLNGKGTDKANRSTASI